MSQSATTNEEMARAASDFCQSIESTLHFERQESAEELAGYLAALIARSYGLNYAEYDGEADTIESRVPCDRWAEVYAGLQSSFGEWDNYWTTLAPYRVNRRTGEPDMPDSLRRKNDQLVNLSLADALTDIWAELRPGLDDLDRGRAIAEVVWEWRHSFHTHWGSHAAEALRALHQQIVAARSK